MAMAIWPCTIHVRHNATVAGSVLATTGLTVLAACSGGSAWQGLLAACVLAPPRYHTRVRVLLSAWYSTAVMHYLYTFLAQV